MQRSSWFPIDIIHEIVQFCDLSTLLEVALISKDCQSPAESLIYRTISFDNYRCRHENCHCHGLERRVENCLKSLAAHPNKACHTRAFHLELGSDTVHHDDDGPFFDILAAALLAVTRLEVLQLKFSLFFDYCIVLSALQRCTFSLKTIIVPASLDPAKWARFHDNLREVRFHKESGWDPNLETISVYRQWTAHSSHRLIVWALRPLGSFSEHILAYPVLNPYWSARPIREILNNSISSLKNNDDFVLCRFNTAELWVSSITGKTLINNLKSLNESFPAIQHLYLIVEDAESYEPSTVLSTALSSLPRLATLYMLLLNRTKLTSVSLERELELAHTWAEASPNLKEIVFLSGNILDRNEGSQIWTLRPPRLNRQIEPDFEE
ncbi:hypothetical protein E4T56_gene7266 [Termitomyces sp. T112]|nr:hypothetical protein E4T56_gene7266 [Termitomyces sp. T112]